MNRNLLLLLCSFSLTLATAQSWETETLNSADLIYDANEHIEEEEYEDALRLLSLVLEGDTNYNLSLFYKSLAYYSDEQFDSCIAVCQEGLAKDSLNSDLYKTLARA